MIKYDQTFDHRLSEIARIEKFFYGVLINSEKNQFDAIFTLTILKRLNNVFDIENYEQISLMHALIMGKYAEFKKSDFSQQLARILLFGIKEIERTGIKDNNYVLFAVYFIKHYVSSHDEIMDILMNLAVSEDYKDDSLMTLLDYFAEQQIIMDEPDCIMDDFDTFC